MSTTENTTPTVGAKAQARFVRITPMKARRVVDMVRGKNVQEAIHILTFAPQGASEQVLKTLKSAVANARQKADQARRLRSMSVCWSSPRRMSTSARP